MAALLYFPCAEVSSETTRLPTCNSSRSPSTARRGLARQTAAEDGASTMGFFQLGMRLKEAIVKVQMYSAEYDGGRVRAGQRWLQSEMDV